MLEVPGMTEAALGALTPNALASLRWGLYARALAPSATTDIGQALEAIADEERTPNAATLQVRRARRREVLAGAQRDQATIRALLFLDDDTADDDEAEVVA